MLWMFLLELVLKYYYRCVCEEESCHQPATPLKMSRQWLICLHQERLFHGIGILNMHFTVTNHSSASALSLHGPGFFFIWFVIQKGHIPS